MKKILIIGNAGAGKSTLARTLSERLSIPAVHLDHLFWKPGWIQRSPEEFDSRLHELLETDAWIMDGNYSRTLPERLSCADMVIFLDFPRMTCLYRVLKRWLWEKSEQASGCPQKVDFEFVKYIVWDYYRNNRKKNIGLLKEHQKTFVQHSFHSHDELQSWLASW